MLNSVFAKTLRDARNGIIWWGIGIGSLGLLVGLVFPLVRDNADGLTSFIEELPEWLLSMMGDFSNFQTIQGWVELRFMSFVPLLLSAATIAAGSGALAGEEDRHTMDLLMSQPQRRWKVVAEKFAAIVLSTVLITAIASILLVAGILMTNVEFDLLTTFLSPFSALPLALAVGGLALFGSAFLPTRGGAVALAAVVLTASYFLNAFAQVVDVLRGARAFSLYYYFATSHPMLGMMEWAHILFLLALTVVFFGAALWAFERRELRL